MIYLKFLVPCVFFYILTATLNTATGEEVVVTIPQGKVRGRKEHGSLGINYYSFQGIPYAKPPMGDQRFKPPQPAGNWPGILDATKPGAACPGNDVWTLRMIANASEDCLNMFVYTREIPKPGKKYPVLVWIHGGGFNYQIGNKNFYSPDYFMAHDIVFVSFNYRLGALGFLSLQNMELPGNNGMKDQVLALKWIKNNIHHFGGNPDSVTIFGESAGSAAVHYHLLSPASKGLFHRAMACSAAANNFWAMQKRPREYAYLLGKRLGFMAKNDKELLDFLRKATPDDIAIQSAGILNELKVQRSYENIMNFSYVPSVEPEHEGAFMTTYPLKGKYQADVPFITGNTNKELIMEVYDRKLLPQWKDDKEFQELIPRGFPFEKNSEKSLEIARKIREFYFKDGFNLDAYIDVLSDIYFNHGIHRAINHRLKNPKIKSPTYLYLFSFEGKLSFGKRYIETIRRKPVEIKGVSHADDLGYLFAHDKPKFALTPGTPEHKTILRYTQVIVNFATLGVPTNEKSEVKWPPMKTSDDVYLDIGNELKVKKGLFKERMQFWDEIYNLAGEE